MFPRTTLIAATTTVLALLAMAGTAQAQSRIYGTLSPVRSAGPCTFNLNFPTDSSITRTSVIWGLKDKKDTLATPSGLHALASGSSFPSSFTSQYYVIPNTILSYMSKYSLSRWDKRRKTVTMLKESWVFTGWGSSTTIQCYGAWAGEVKYK